MNLAITGGTGSLGHALVREFLRRESRIVILSRDELKQAQMAETFKENPILRFFLGDVRDRDRLTEAFYGCDTVIHAAALKRVDATSYNPSELLKTNVLGTLNTIKAACDAKVARVLVVSSDKAVMPTNAYGASKQMAEQLAVALNTSTYPRGTLVSVLRYGNVVGSRGSVTHLWAAQHAQGEPLTLTDFQMTRFWVTLPQAADHVRAALERAQGGEIFVPKLPASTVLALLRTRYPDDALRITGLRPGGEKLSETLMAPEEATRARDIGKAYVIAPASCSWGVFEAEGNPLPHDFRYTSDRGTISQEELEALALWAAPSL